MPDLMREDAEQRKRLDERITSGVCTGLKVMGFEVTRTRQLEAAIRVYARDPMSGTTWEVSITRD